VTSFLTADRVGQTEQFGGNLVAVVFLDQALVPSQAVGHEDRPTFGRSLASLH
jgi:hypothetical protein